MTILYYFKSRPFDPGYPELGQPGTPDGEPFQENIFNIINKKMKDRKLKKRKTEEDLLLLLLENTEDFDL